MCKVNTGGDRSKKDMFSVTCLKYLPLSGIWKFMHVLKPPNAVTEALGSTKNWQLGQLEPLLQCNVIAGWSSGSSAATAQHG